MRWRHTQGEYLAVVSNPSRTTSHTSAWRMAAGPLACAAFWAMGAGGLLAMDIALACAVAAWVILWWVLEAVPIAVASLLPIVLVPLFGLGDMGSVTAHYGSKYVFLFMGGFLVAIAMEKWNLHRRIALGILLRSGVSPTRILAGFMLATFGLSMWLSNTATTLMMLPIALSIASQMPQLGTRGTTALLLGTAYAANIGGTATLVGTPPNTAMAGLVQQQFDIALPFLEWMAMALPFACLLILAIYFVLRRQLPHPSTSSSNGHPTDADGNQVVDSIESAWNALGRITSAEQRVGAVFLTLAALWMSRRLLVDWTGWPLDDTAIGMAAGLSLFLIRSGHDAGNDGLNRPPLMTWDDGRKLPWDILLLFGGGLALADTLKGAGVLDALAGGLAALGQDGTSFAMVALMALIVMGLFATELMSNLALTVVAVPAAGAFAIELGLPVLQAVVPLTLVSSCAFMLPMATPPNAIVFGSGRIRMADMVRIGLVCNLIAAGLAILWAFFVLPVWSEWALAEAVMETATEMTSP